MREYAKAEPKMWHGETMKALRKTREGLIVGLYLMTSPSSNMLGLFAQPVLYMAYETGLGEEGLGRGSKAASKRDSAATTTLQKWCGFTRWPATR